MWFCKLQNWTQPTNFDLYHLKIKFDLDKTAIDTVSNLVFWRRFANKLEPWHNVYIIQQ